MTYVNALAALADPTRRAVFERLRAGPAAVGALAAGLPVSRPAVSQHLAVLREAGLVTDEARGTARIYRLRADGLAALKAWIDSFWDEPLARFKEHAEKTDDRR